MDNSLSLGDHIVPLSFLGWETNRIRVRTCGFHIQRLQMLESRGNLYFIKSFYLSRSVLEQFVSLE